MARKKKVREGKGKDDLDRDAIVEAGRKLKEAKEATASSKGESGVGVKSSQKAWDNRYPRGAKVEQE